MPILPIDTGRYGSPEMRRIFEEENRLQKMLDVEAALAWAHAQFGNIPKESAQMIMSKASTSHVKVARVKEIDLEIKHDLMAMVKALVELCGESGGFVHLGATSSDILDTATALQIREALEIMTRRLDRLEELLLILSEKYRGTIMVGRTHGQYAAPITLGLKFAVWMREISRHVERLQQLRPRVEVGKMTGAVGTQAGLGSHAVGIQSLVMDKLGLAVPDVTTQILQRDRYGELLCFLANLASSLDKFSTEIRNLQRPEIGELSEPFEFEKQVGSSTMPHKMNPVTSENTCSLAKLVRGLVGPALEDVVTWHERDLTQSAAERFLIPESFILADQMLMNMTRVLEGIRVHEENIGRNLELAGGAVLSEALMLALASKGVGRQEAHEVVRKIAVKSVSESKIFSEMIRDDPLILRWLDRKELDEIMNPRNYLGTTKEQIERAVKKTRDERNKRGL